MPLIFGYEPKGSINLVEITNDLDGIVDELMFRNDHCQTLYPGYREMSWDEVCDRGIELLTQLKGCDPC